MTDAFERAVQVTFDAVEPHDLSRWWADLLGYQVEDVQELVADLLERDVIASADVAEVGGRLTFAGASAASDPRGRGPRLYFQRVPEAKVAKNRVHLDVSVAADQLEAEVARVEAAGGTLVGYNSHPGHRWAVMHDPEGNEFCLH